jgi:hypothetical protein
MKEMKKVIRDGMVAVLYSPGFGAGWYTWNHEFPEMIFDPDIVALVEPFGDDEVDEETRLEIEKMASEKWPGCYAGGADDLTVMWMPEGAQFEIEEYDGSETVHQIGGREYIKA